jgi:RecJ-like exonuclease
VPSVESPVTSSLAITSSVEENNIENVTSVTTFIKPLYKESGPGTLCQKQRGRGKGQGRGRGKVRGKGRGNSTVKRKKSKSTDESEDVLCPECNKDLKNAQWIQCDTCDVWYHRQCTKISSETEWEHTLKEEVQWNCHKC